VDGRSPGPGSLGLSPGAARSPRPASWSYAGLWPPTRRGWPEAMWAKHMTPADEVLKATAELLDRPDTHSTDTACG
jgi:hypothetical protein